MTKLSLVALMLLAAAAVCGPGGIWAQTPEVNKTPTPEGSETLGPTYQLTVIGRDGGPAPDGTRLFIGPVVGSALSVEELERARRSGTGPGVCENATDDSLIVRDGQVELRPVLTEQCPEGTRLIIAIDFGDGSPPIIAAVEPDLEWRPARAVGETIQATVRPIPPNTGGNASQPISPPDTGSAVSAPTDDSSRSLNWGYVAFGVAILLGLSSFGIALTQRSRSSAK